MSQCLQGNLAFGGERQEPGHCEGVTSHSPASPHSLPRPSCQPAQTSFSEGTLRCGGHLGWLLFSSTSGYMAMWV